MPLDGFLVNKNTGSSVQFSSEVTNLYTSFGRMYNILKFKLTCRTKHKKIARDSVPILLSKHFVSSLFSAKPKRQLLK